MRSAVPVAFLSWFILLISCGCTTTYVSEGPAPGVRVRDPRAPGAQLRMNTVNIIDKSLQNWDGKVYDPPWSSIFQSGPKERHKRSKIAVESTNSKRTPTGTLEVWALLRNRTDYPLQIEGRTQFFDADKNPLEGPTAWKRVDLAPNSTATFRDYSTKTDAVAYYYVEIREDR